jgi:hypothetical protein
MRTSQRTLHLQQRQRRGQECADRAFGPNTPHTSDWLFDNLFAKQSDDCYVVKIEWMREPEPMWKTSSPVDAIRSREARQKLPWVPPLLPLTTRFGDFGYTERWRCLAAAST